MNGHDEAKQPAAVDLETTAEGPVAESTGLETAVPDSPSVEFTIVHNKDKHTVTMPQSSTIKQLKDKLADVIGVPSKMQKIMIKGLAKDDQTLESLNVNSSSKIMVVGAKLQDIVAVSAVNVDEVCAMTAFTVYSFGHQWFKPILFFSGLEFVQIWNVV